MVGDTHRSVAWVVNRSRLHGSGMVRSLRIVRCAMRGWTYTFIRQRGLATSTIDNRDPNRACLSLLDASTFVAHIYTRTGYTQKHIFLCTKTINSHPPRRLLYSRYDDPLQTLSAPIQHYTTHRPPLTSSTQPHPKGQKKREGAELNQPLSNVYSYRWLSLIPQRPLRYLWRGRRMPRIILLVVRRIAPRDCGASTGTLIHWPAQWLLLI